MQPSLEQDLFRRNKVPTYGTQRVDLRKYIMAWASSLYSCRTSFYGGGAAGYSNSFGKCWALALFP